MPKRQRQVSLDEHTIEAVQRFADHCEWSWSKAAARCIERGLTTDRATTQQIADPVTALREIERIALRGDVNIQPLLAPILGIVRAALAPFAEDWDD